MMYVLAIGCFCAAAAYIRSACKDECTNAHNDDQSDDEDDDDDGEEDALERTCPTDGQSVELSEAHNDDEDTLQRLVRASKQNDGGTQRQKHILNDHEKGSDKSDSDNSQDDDAAQLAFLRGRSPAATQNELTTDI